MKRKSILLLSLSAVAFAFSFTSERTVYLCNSETAYAYHYDKNCRGLKNCTHGLIEVTESKAKSQKRKLCGWED